MSLNKSEEFTRHFVPSVSLDILLMLETSGQLIGPLVRVLDGLCSFDVSTRLFMVTETEACVLRLSVDYRTIVQGTVETGDRHVLHIDQLATLDRLTS